MVDAVLRERVGEEGDDVGRVLVVVRCRVVGVDHGELQCELVVLLREVLGEVGHL